MGAALTADMDRFSVDMPNDADLKVRDKVFDFNQIKGNLTIKYK